MPEFDEKSARRLARTMKYTESRPRSRAPGLRGPADFSGAVMLVVAVALNPMSGASPGKNGRGKVQKFDGTTYSDLSTTVYTIVNDQEKSVAVGAYVLCLPGPGGKFHMVAVDKCSRLS